MMILEALLDGLFVKWATAEGTQQSQLIYGTSS